MGTSMNRFTQAAGTHAVWLACHHCATITIWAIRDLAWTDRTSRVGQPPPSPATWLVEGIADGTLSFPVSHVDILGR